MRKGSGRLHRLALAVLPAVVLTTGSLGAQEARVLPVDEAAEDAGFFAFRARLAGGSLGYVRSRSVRSPIDHRAIFSRRDGRWWMITFIAGD